MIRVVSKQLDGPFELVEGLDAAEAAIQRWTGGKERVWLDIEAAAPPEVDLIRRSLHFDELSLEDAANGNHPPKVEEVAPDGDRPAYLFVVATAPRREAPDESESVALFLRSRLLVSFHSTSSPRVDAALSRMIRDPKQTIGRGIEFAAHAVLDELADVYERLLDEFDHRIELLEDEVEEEDDVAAFGRILGLRREVTHVWRFTRPMRDVVSSLSRDGHPLVKPKARLAFRDLYDQIQRTHDRLESQREAIYSIRDAHLALTNNRMNEVMKTLTVVAVMSGFLSVLTGFFGMNLPIPGSSEPASFWVTLVGMILAAGGILLFFRWRRWL